VKVKITHKDLVGPVKHLTGFSGLNAGRSECSQPWARLERVGHALIGQEYKAFTGSICFLVRQGGVHEENLPRKFKTIFREDVFPAILNFDPKCTQVFEMTLYFNEGLLMLAELEYK